MAEVKCMRPRCDRRRIAFMRGLEIALGLSLAIGACRSPGRDGRGPPNATDGRGGALTLSAAGGAQGSAPVSRSP